MFPYSLHGIRTRLVAVNPKRKFVDGQATGEQSVEADGTPQWSVATKILYTDRDGDPVSARINVTVASKTEPAINVGEPVEFEDMLVGNSPNGLYFRAANVAPGNEDMFE